MRDAVSVEHAALHLKDATQGDRSSGGTAHYMPDPAAGN